MSERLRWWLQMVESTAFENADELRTEMELSWGGFASIYWDKESPMPDGIEGHGFDVTEIPDLPELFDTIQMYLEDREYLIVKLTLDNEIYSPSTEYHVLTRRIAAKVSGDELAERAKRLVLSSEEDLLKDSDSS